MTDSPAIEQKKSRRGLLVLVGAGGAAAVAALLGRRSGAEAAPDNPLIMGQTNDSEAAPTTLAAYPSVNPALTVENSSTNFMADGIWGKTNGSGAYGVHGSSHVSGGVGVKGWDGNAGGTAVWGYGSTGVVGQSRDGGTGVKGQGKPGVHGYCNRNDGSGVKGEGDAPGSIGVFAKNTPDRRALRTQGRVQMDTARKVTLSNRTNTVTLPTGVEAGALAIVLAMVQGASGNGAFVRRAWRVDNKHIRITFDKKPANPTAVGYWVVQTG